MARMDYETRDPDDRQDSWRSKRHRGEDANEALAHALLETVRQALDDGADDGTGYAIAPAPAPEPSGQFHTGPHRPIDPEHQVTGPPAVGGGDGVNSGQLLGYRYTEQELHSLLPGLLAGVHWEELRALHQAGLQPDLEHVERAAGRLPLEANAFMPTQGGRTRMGKQAVMAAAAAARLAETRQHGAEEWHLQHVQHLQHAGGSASHDSATTTLNTGEDAGEDENTEAGVANEGGSAPRKKQPGAKPVLPGGPCAHCGTTESPQWRRPLTRKVVLCNACGIYFSRHHSLPNRKKVASSGASPAAGRTPKPDPASPQRDPAAESIICDEELEADEQPLAAPSATGRASRKPSRQAHGQRQRVDEQPHQHVGSQRRPLTARHGKGPDIAGFETCAEEAAPVERIVFSLPTLPVLGGMNVIVQSFLSKNSTSSR